MARILLADDEEDVAIIVNEYLKPHGHQIFWAEDGGSAWEMFEKEEYDLVILDLRMPVMDGYTVCKRIKQSAKPHIPVLFLSGHINERGFHEKNLSDDFVSKPFSAATLHDAVKRLLRQGAKAHGNQNPKDPS